MQWGNRLVLKKELGVASLGPTLYPVQTSLLYESSPHSKLLLIQHTDSTSYIEEKQSTDIRPYTKNRHTIQNRSAG